MSGKTQSKLDITIGLNNIRLHEFTTTQRVLELKNPPAPDIYEFQFDLDSKIIESDKLFSIALTVTLYEKQDENTKIELAKIKTINDFNIVNFEEVFKKADDKLLVPNQLIALAAGIAISSARGIFLMCVKDTILNNALIPIINPQMFVPKTNS